MQTRCQAAAPSAIQTILRSATLQALNEFVTSRMSGDSITVVQFQKTSCSAGSALKIHVAMAESN
jgi:hypothetical protein